MDIVKIERKTCYYIVGASLKFVKTMILIQNKSENIFTTESHLQRGDLCG